MDVNEDQEQLCPSWDDVPTDILLLIFENMPTSSLAVCMFVSQIWRSHAEHVIEVKNKWQELFDSTEFKLKCDKSFDVQQMYYNNILWNSFPKATVKLHQVREVNGIKKMIIYRDHLIAVSQENLQYYDAKTLNVNSTVAWRPCEDFYENDVMAVGVFKSGKYLKLQLFLKLDLKVIDMTESNALTVDNVICYKIHDDECHVLDHRNVHSMYTIVDGRWWQKKTLCRYYGNPDYSCAINVFDNQFYLMLKGAFLLLIDQNNGQLKKMTQVTVCKSSRICDLKMLRRSENMELIHRKMFLWCGMHDIEVYSRPMDSSKSLRVERCASWSNPVDESIIFVYKVRNVSCMLQHGDLLFLGHLDGTVELINSKTLSQDLSNTEPLRRFNIKDFMDIADVAVISIDVYEDEGIQHMFVATNTLILHLHITHTNCEDYMWSDEACKISIMSMHAR